MNWKRWTIALAWIVAGLALVAYGAHAALDVQAQGANLLINGGFEPPYTERASRVIVAHGWQWAHWDRYMPPEVEGGSSGPIIRPEFKEAPYKTDPDRVVSGSAQCWFYAFAVGDAVVYQQVPVVKGQWYRADGSAESWVTNDSTDTDADGEMLFAVGIDPYGGTVAWKSAVIWSPLTWSGHDHRRIYSPVVQAQSDRITVFYRAVAKWAKRNNDAYWDDAHLAQVELGGDCPPCPTCPAPQPCPTCEPGGECECLTLPELRAELDKLRIVRQ